MSIQTSNANYNNGGSIMMANFGTSGRPPSSSTATSNGSGGNTGINCSNNGAMMGPNGAMFMQIPAASMAGGMPSTSIAPSIMHSGRPRLDVHSDKRLIVQAMLSSSSGLEIRNRTWLKMLIPMSFLGLFCVSNNLKNKKYLIYLKLFLRK